MTEQPRILFCRCAFAQVVPRDVKEEVLQQLVAAEIPFDAAADLCEMSARKDPALRQLAGQGELRIAACYPRAVKWLFSAAGAPLPTDRVQILNMRTQTAAEITTQLFAPPQSAAAQAAEMPQPDGLNPAAQELKTTDSPALETAQTDLLGDPTLVTSEKMKPMSQHVAAVVGAEDSAVNGMATSQEIAIPAGDKPNAADLETRSATSSRLPTAIGETALDGASATPSSSSTPLGEPS